MRIPDHPTLILRMLQHRLKKLTTLHLSDNKLQSLPGSIGKLNNLTRLDVRNNPKLEVEAELVERLRSQGAVVLLGKGPEDGKGKRDGARKGKGDGSGKGKGGGGGKGKGGGGGGGGDGVEAP